MPAARDKTSAIHLITGDDEFSIKEAAAKLAESLTPQGAGEFGLEVVEGETTNQDFALTQLARLDEALFTIGFFGGEKLVWWKNTELLADTPTTRGAAVKEALVALAEKIKAGLPAGTRLLISAIGCDKRRTTYKTLEKLAAVQLFNAPEAGKADGEEEIGEFIQRQLRAEGKRFAPGGLEAFRALVAPSLRELANELEKLFIYAGARPELTAADVRAICSATRQAVIWELTDTLGARRIGPAVAALEQLLAQGEEPIGVVMLLVNQFRLILLARDLMRRKLVVPEDNNGFRYVKAYEGLPAEAVAHFPRTKEGTLPNGWRLYRCALAARNFTTGELIRALDLLAECYRQLVTTQLDEKLVLEQAIIKIATRQPAAHG